jgi:hypothetical protein
VIFLSGYAYFKSFCYFPGSSYRVLKIEAENGFPIKDLGNDGSGASAMKDLSILA